LVGVEISGAIEREICLVRMRQVRGAADEPGDIFGQRIENLAGGVAGGHALRVGGKGGKIFVPAVGQLEIFNFV
jgi:hypothetical protein